MSTKTDIAAEADLQFFGKISASISHEIKNVLAIINENAGLLEDLVFMAEKGKALEPARLQLIAATVLKQVGRADLILKNMNRFAHSIDEKFADVDLNQMMKLVKALTERFAAMQGVRVELSLSSDSPTITTAPFYLINLICLCLDFSMAAAADEKRLDLIIAEADDSVLIHFSGLASLTPELSQTFPTDTENRLLSELAAGLITRTGENKITLQLPKKLEYSDVRKSITC